MMAITTSSSTSVKPILGREEEVIRAPLRWDGERAVAARFDRRQFGATRNAKSPTAAVIALAGRLDNTVSHFIRKFNSIAELGQSMAGESRGNEQQHARASGGSDNRRGM